MENKNYSIQSDNGEQFNSLLNQFKQHIESCIDSVHQRKFNKEGFEQFDKNMKDARKLLGQIAESNEELINQTKSQLGL